MQPPPSTGSAAGYTPGPNTERLSAALADRYRIERLLGQGGMASVYLAHDIKHDRRVALKVLKPELSAVLGGDRFVVEIKTTASLQHPHILPLFDSGSADGLLFYVMPFIEGETLRSKLNRETQFSVDEAVRIARDVADALDYAHRHGVVHRDIKPENILLHDGRPVVADFGIALAVSAAAGGRMTETGLSLGTPHYMSPEQATAEKDITARSDIYSIGSVLYEMLTGNPPHTGASAQQIIMKIITDEAEPVTKYRKTVPPHVAAAVARALEKLPADRFESAKAFAEALTNPAFTNATAATAARGIPALRPFSSAPFIAVTAIAIVASAAAIWGWMRPAPARDVSRFTLHFPDSQQVSGAALNGIKVALSPDGRTMVCVGQSALPGYGQIWVRRMDQLRATPIAGSERAANPSVSPDNRSVAFLSLQQPRALRVAPLGGGPIRTLTDSLVDLGGISWGYDGYIYYDGHLEGDGIARIRENGGGKPERVSIPDSTANETYHFNPSTLPNGRGVLMTIARPGGIGAFDVGVVDLRTGKHKVLTRGVVGRYAASGHLVYGTSDGMLVAAPFDANTLEVTGDAVLIADRLAVRSNQRVDIAVSEAGHLIYGAGSAIAGIRELVWVNRDGVPTRVDSAWSGETGGRPALSPDGRYVAIAVGRANARSVWVKQLDRGPITRVADLGGMVSWSPDGKNLIYSSAAGVHSVPADGHSLPVALTSPKGTALGSVGASNPQYSPDGKWIVFGYRGNIHGVRADGDTSERILIEDQNTQMLAAFSPDGRWLAYASDESGNFQVYVRPFPNTRLAKRQVSTGTGFAPRWSRSGRELFYYDAGLHLWAVEVIPGPVFANGTPRRLFSAAAFGPLTNNQFDVAADGRRFLFTRDVSNSAGGTEQDDLVFVQNFFEELKAKVPR